MDKGTIRIKWNVDEKYDAYSVCVKENEEKELVKIFNPNINSISIADCIKGKEYNFIVWGIDNNSNYSKICEFFSFFNGKKTITYLYKTPELLNAIVKENAAIISWNPINGNNEYLIIRKCENGKWQRVGISRKAYFIDTAFDSTKKNFYSVRCFDAENDRMLSSFDTKGILLK